MQIDWHIVLDTRTTVEQSRSVDSMVRLRDGITCLMSGTIDVLDPDAAVSLSNALLVAAANRRRALAEKAAEDKRQLELGVSG